MITTLSAAQLVRVYNAVTDGKPVKKFESQPRALERTQAELARMGVTSAEAMARAGFQVPAKDEAPDRAAEPYIDRHGAEHLDPPHRKRRLEAAIHARVAAAAPGPVNLLTGDTLPRKQSYATDPTRKAEGDPAKAARKVARKAAAPLRAARKAADAAKAAPATAAPARISPPALRHARKGAARSNERLPQVVEALRAREGATLAELTQVAGWSAPFELANLRIAAKKMGFKFEALTDGAYRIVEG